MAAPKWTDYVKGVVPLVVGGASVVLTLALNYADPAGAAAWTALLAGFGVNIASGAVAALCQPEKLNAHKEHQEVLANHDIVRLVQTAWGEAAVATIEAYWEAHGNPNHGYLEERVKTAKPQDFEPQAITVKAIQDSLAESRRALLSGSQGTEGVAADLQQQLVDSVCALMMERWGFPQVPDDLKSYLAEHLPRQLFLYVAYYLKTDSRAQTAILHFTLQELKDGQTRMQLGLDELCGRFTAAEKGIGSKFAELLKEQNGQLHAMMRDVVEARSNRDKQPPLAPPFVRSVSVTTDFIFRARATKLVGRDKAMEDLKDFLADDRPGLWTIISGPAGTGKSRLAAELVAAVRDPYAPDSPEVPPGQWRAGFVRRPDIWIANTDNAARWVPAADSLLVIDYASDLPPKPLADFLAHLEGCQTQFHSSGFNLFSAVET